MTTHIFHFTLGPVQGFVAQARRTRDLWAGSFVLSWLAGQAMAEVRRQGGDIVFPAVGNKDRPGDPLIAAIEGKPLERDKVPRIGSLPNRFKARVPDHFEPAQVEQAARAAWSRLGEAVWTRFVAEVAGQGLKTRAIWDRQIDGFWDVNWVIGEDPGNGSDALWLEARKNWRDRWPAAEGGDHCALMGDWQELSGFVRARQRDRQDAFWQALRSHTGALELRDNERLCAIALVKRLFPRLPKDALQQAIGWVPGGKPEAIGNWPSTAYMASIPWLREYVDDEDRRRQLEAYEQIVIIAAASQRVRGERCAQITSLVPLNELAWLDGNFFLQAALANAGDTPLADEAAREALLRQLQALQKGHPTQPFYAVLLLDGDSLGKHLGTGDATKISKSLADFSQNVAAIVDSNDGVTLYAGGDDVLALLPMDRAVACASALRVDYGKAFGDATFTASVAIVFAHYHLPLRETLAAAHHQLDEVAKDGNGRDSLAMAWFKASGLAAEWVATWTDAGAGQPVKQLETLANAIREDAFAAGFFYKLRRRYPMLDHKTDEPVAMAGIARMLEAEYLKSRERKTSLEQAEHAIDTLIQACRPARRNPQGKPIAPPPGKLQLDGLRVARLLAGKEAPS